MLDSDMEFMSREEILAQVRFMREKIEAFRERLSRGEIVDYNEMRRAMGDLNHLKIHARKRGINLD